MLLHCSRHEAPSIPQATKRKQPVHQRPVVKISPLLTEQSSGLTPGTIWMGPCSITNGSSAFDNMSSSSSGGKNRIAIDVSFRLLSTVHLPAP